MDDAERVHFAFLTRLAAGDLPRPKLSLAEAGLAPERALALFRSQVSSRQLDRVARRLQARGEGFYTIGSSGHEGNAAVAEALRADDIAFLHYRSAAFQLHRASLVPAETPEWDMLLSFVASAEDPISGGRHKVLGSKRLTIPPQTSTVASHLPKAVGAAFGIALAQALGLQETPLAADGVVLASFGDASANHSTAQGAINTALWAAYQGTPMPLVLLCEDNGIGIGTRTPPGWIEHAFARRPGLHYLECDGCDLADSWRGAREAADYARSARRPVFLHMRTVRLYGHAGSDAQSAYLTPEEIRRDEARDPLLAAAALLLREGLMTAEAIRDLYQETEARLLRLAEEAVARPRLADAAAVMASIVPPPREPRPIVPASEARDALFASDRALIDQPQPMAKLLSWALADILLAHPHAFVAGEDVGAKGGVYGVTARLRQRFGRARVIDTVLDEQAILGLAIGAAHNGLLPIVEIQFLAYLHNAEDQLRGEAATLSFFSCGQFTNPMVVRIAGLAYQKGFGGHFHNDNSLAVLRDIPGLILAVPSSGGDAVALLRECVRLADEEQRVVVMVEPIALYATRDLHQPGDGLWAGVYRPPGKGGLSRGEVGVRGEGEDLAIVSYGNGFYLSCQAAKLLAAKGHGVRLVDLRWLAPLPVEALLAATLPCRHVLIVDECRISGSVSEALMALFAERSPGMPVARLAAEDSFIPLGRAATLTLPSRDSIVAAALALVARDPPHGNAAAPPAI